MNFFRVFTFIIIAILLFLPISSGQTPSPTVIPTPTNTPTPEITATPHSSYDPRSLSYWQIYGTEYYNDYYDSSNLPITLNTQTPLPSGDQILYKDGFLLKKGANDELVLFRGAGTYYELASDNDLFHINDFGGVCATLKSNNINLVRLFVGSGPPDNPNDDRYFKIYPFPYDGNYKLHLYNDDYFTRLEEFLTEAEAHNIVVLLSLFDFSWDLTGDRWDAAAWNPANNDHGDDLPPTPSQGYEDQNPYFFEIFNNSSPAEGLNMMGLAQRDFVLKVVAETRHHWNIIYEIANEPKLRNIPADTTNLLRNWVSTVIYWIREGAGYGYPGVPNAIIGFVEGFTDEHTKRVMSSVEGIDILERHGAFGGFDKVNGFGTTCDQRAAGFNLNLLAQSAKLREDQYRPNPGAEGYFGLDKTRICLVDTDGIHRGGDFGGNENMAWGRDFDGNCRAWACISHLHGSQFVTKEAIWKTDNQDEDDCNPTPGIATPSCGDSAAFGYKQLFDNNWNCDDDYFEGVTGIAKNPGSENKFDGFDWPLGIALGELDIHSPYLRSAGWGDRMPILGGSVDLYISNGNLFGNSTGADLTSYMYFIPESDPDFDNGHLIQFSNYRQYNTFYSGLPLTWFSQASYYALALTEDATLQTHSDLWPIVSVHPDPITTASPTPGSNPLNIQALSNIIIDYNPPDLPENLIRRWAIEENLSSNRDGERPIICQAGWEYTKLYNLIYAPGILECDVIICDPNPALTPGSDLELEVSTDKTYWQPLASSNDIIPVSIPPYYNTPTPTGTPSLNQTRQYFRYKFSCNVDPEDLPEGGLSDSFILYLRVVKNDEDYSDTWPIFTVHAQNLTSIYVSPDGSDQRGDGSIDHPFKTIQAAITYGKNNYDAGELEPIQIFLEPGTYTTKYKNEIILPESFQIKGSGIDNSVIQLDLTAQENGQYLVAGHHSVISDCTIKCGSLVEHSDVVFRNCKFDVDPKMFQGNSFQAIDVQGWHDVSINNCIFHGCSCQNIVKAGLDSIVKMFDCDILSCSNGISFTENSLGFISNSIFQSTAGTCIAASGESEVTVEYSCFYNNTTNMNSTGGSVIQSGNLLYSNPLIVNAASGDYHLQQPTIQDNSIGASPCIDAGRYAVPGTRASTCIDGSRDIDQFDIGFHYAFEDYRYSVPRFKTETDAFGTWTTEVTIQNPNDYPVLMVMTWFSADGSSSTEGDDITIDPHGYHIETITSVNAPYTVGSIEVETDGPVFGQIRSESYSVSTGRNSHTTQMQREWSLGDELSAANLCTGTWNAEVGGGTNDVWTEIILKNFNDEEVSFTGKFYHNNGQHASGQDISADPLDPHESRSIVKAPGFPVAWGNFEVQGASLPIVGEVIIHSEQQNSPYHNLSEDFILVPEPEYSSSLVEPCFLLGDFGSTIWQQWILLKNPTTGSINATITLYHSDGTAFNPQPYPSPVAVNSKSNIALSSYNLLGTGEMASVLINSASNLMAYSEMVCYVPSSNDLVIGGSELDSSGEAHTRYFMPSARNVNSQGYPSEESWITIRNLTSQSNCFTVRIYDDTGTLIDEESDSLDGSALMTIGFRSGCDVFVNPGSNERFSVEIESESPISGWTENFWAMTNASDHWYDANMLQKW